jgi:hypothetical protein
MLVQLALNKEGIREGIAFGFVANQKGPVITSVQNSSVWYHTITIRNPMDLDLENSLKIKMLSLK